jgi:putative transposase
MDGMERTIDMAIDKELLDQLLDGRDPQDLFAKDGLIDELKTALNNGVPSGKFPRQPRRS